MKENKQISFSLTPIYVHPSGSDVDPFPDGFID